MSALPLLDIYFAIPLLFLLGLLLILTYVVVSKKRGLLDWESDLVGANDSIRELYNGDRYLAESDYRSWIDEYGHLKELVGKYVGYEAKIRGVLERSGALNRPISKYLELFYIGKHLKDILFYLNDVFRDGLEGVKRRNEEFIENEMIKYSKLFDSIEDKSLTSAQKRAIIIDEAYNLVIAGVGTGGKSTIVGKIGYITYKDLASPDEILLLTLDEEKAAELRKLIRNKVGVSVKIKTIAGIASDVLRLDAGMAPKVSGVSMDPDKFQELIDDLFLDRMNDIRFIDLVNLYLTYHQFPVENVLNIDSRDRYEDYMTSREIKTLKGETVEGLEECTIANFLYLNNVEYEYRKEYIYRTPLGEYRPDFYLSRYGIWIENFCLDRSCGTTRDIDRWEVLDACFDKRRIHKQYNTELLETYSYEYEEGSMIANLESQLSVRGVSFDKSDRAEIYERLKYIGDVERLVGLLSKFMRLYGARPESIQLLREKAKSYPLDIRYLAFLDIFEMIERDYSNYLESNQVMDHDDLIEQVSRIIMTGGISLKYKYIIVDDFQDISYSGYELLKAIHEACKDSKLFFIGDDWQAIERVSGGDVAIMLSFEGQFNPSETTVLDETFKLNLGIWEFSSTFIEKNPDQLKKEIKAKIGGRGAVTLIWYEDLNRALEGVLQEAKREEKTVLVIGRYEAERYPDLDPSHLGLICDLDSEVEIVETGARVKFLTAREAKDEEADYVVILGLRSGRFGFPDETEDDPVLNLVLSRDDCFQNAEERRIFYVMVTRAKERVYLLADKKRVSKFAEEIQREDYEINIRIEGREQEGGDAKEYDIYEVLINTQNKWESLWKGSGSESAIR